jgi:hypothetical protein
MIGGWSVLEVSQLCMGAAAEGRDGEQNGEQMGSSMGNSMVVCADQGYPKRRGSRGLSLDLRVSDIQRHPPTTVPLQLRGLWCTPHCQPVVGKELV